MRLKINEPNVVYEAFDDEVILVNLDTGNYYSVRGSGPALWLALSNGVTPAQVTAAIASATQPEASSLLGVQVERFAQALLDAQLVVMAPEDGANPFEWQGAFEEPLLEIYSDMQDLLMLDPIHDVDATGWPMAKEG